LHSLTSFDLVVTMVKVAAAWMVARLATSEACVSLDQYECWFFSVESHTGPFGTFSQSEYGCSGTMEVPDFFADTSNWNGGTYGYNVDDRGITRSDGLTGTFGSSEDRFQIKWSDGAVHTEDPYNFCDQSALQVSECQGSCCSQYCSRDLQAAGHYCGSNGCDCGVCPGPGCTGCLPGNTSLPQSKLEVSVCEGSCCSQYCSRELQAAGHYCGSDGCDCGVCPGPGCTGCRPGTASVLI